MIIRNNAEFGVELALAVPYAYWLHKNNQLEHVVTSKGMKPFYYFCDDVREEFGHRTVDNAEAGLNELPNNWIHGINPLEEPGVLDYSQWTPPPYKEHYKNDEIKFDKPIVFISNKFNLEHGQAPYGYFDIKSLHDMFSYLTESGYSVVYKRVKNTEKHFTIDQNERDSIMIGYDTISADVEGIGIVTDYELTKYFTDVHLFDDVVNNFNQYSYNEVQLKVMANTEKFITVCGGNSILSSFFGGTVISYVHKGKELRKNYFGKDSYIQKLSDVNVIPIYDVIGKINDIEVVKGYGHKINDTGTNDYTELLCQIKEKF
tara:strand:+ start:1320 stop:2270 length:951 start_codon:yes stop_codon:yes gene_type:complete